MQTNERLKLRDKSSKYESDSFAEREIDNINLFRLLVAGRV